jgi:hypothetical protein
MTLVNLSLLNRTVLSMTGHDCGIVKPAYVISTSYAYNEPDLTPNYAKRQCIEYAKVCNSYHTERLGHR